MKKIKIIITSFLSLLIISLLCSSCISASWNNFNRNAGKSKWVSTNPDIWFEQKTYNLQNGNNDFEGEINIDRKITPIFIIFRNAVPAVSVFSLKTYNATNYNPESLVFKGQLKLTKDGFIVSVYEKNEKIFGDKYKTITFVRGQLGTPEK